MRFPKGKKIYVPPVILREIDDIMKHDNLNRRSDAFKRMAEHSLVGREVERVAFWVGLRKKK